MLAGAGEGVEVGAATSWSRPEQAGGIGVGGSALTATQEPAQASQLVPGDQTRSDASSYVPKSIRWRCRPSHARACLCRPPACHAACV